MRATSAIRDIFADVSSRIATMRNSDFTCADCERWARCGLPPSDSCIFRAEQIASGDWKARRRARALVQDAGWYGPEAATRH